MGVMTGFPVTNISELSDNKLDILKTNLNDIRDTTHAEEPCICTCVVNIYRSNEDPKGGIYYKAKFVEVGNEKFYDKIDDLLEDMERAYNQKVENK